MQQLSVIQGNLHLYLVPETMAKDIVTIYLGLQTIVLFWHRVICSYYLFCSVCFVFSGHVDSGSTDGKSLAPLPSNNRHKNIWKISLNEKWTYQIKLLKDQTKAGTM